MKQHDEVLKMQTNRTVAKLHAIAEDATSKKKIDVAVDAYSRVLSMSPKDEKAADFFEGIGKAPQKTRDSNPQPPDRQSGALTN